MPGKAGIKQNFSFQLQKLYSKFSYQVTENISFTSTDFIMLLNLSSVPSTPASSTLLTQLNKKLLGI